MSRWDQVLCLVLSVGVLWGGLETAVGQEVEKWPKGEVLNFKFDESEIYPGTTRDYAVYVPAQYDGKSPACVYICQDGVMYNAPAVFDELIHTGQMPVTIGVFIKPGVNPSLVEGGLGRFNRSFEYDSLGARYAEFLLKELLPDVEKQTTTQGLPIKLSQRGTDRCLAGNSSGGVCAFTAAWEMPEEFSRVFTGVGTYVGLRGANVYPTLIRKYEPKAIRIFLEDGSNDNNIYGGDWWMANQEMERSLVFAGYEVAHAWGDGGHNQKHATEVFPEAMRYLWKEWPAAPQSGRGSPDFKEMLIEGEGWQAVTGEIDESVFQKRNEILVDGVWVKVDHVTFSPDFSVAYRSHSDQQAVESLMVEPNGNLKFSEPYFHLHQPDFTGWIGGSWPIGADPQDKKAAEKQKQIRESLLRGKRVGGSGAYGMSVDRDGRLYVATTLGLQICDPPGRVHCILPMPNHQPALNVGFGGEDLKTLYVQTSEGVFRRRVQHQGLGVHETVSQKKPKL